VVVLCTDVHVGVVELIIKKITWHSWQYAYLSRSLLMKNTVEHAGKILLLKSLCMG
jgi:hypothetical protein